MGIGTVGFEVRRLQIRDVVEEDIYEDKGVRALIHLNELGILMG